MREKMEARRAAGALVVVALAGLVGLGAPGVADANLIGDPTLTMGAGRFGAGGEIDLVFDRDLDFDAGGVGDMETNRLFVTGSYGFLDNVDGFVKLGLWNGEIENTDIDPGLGIGFGGRFSFLERGDLRVGVLGQLIYFTSEVDAPGSPSIDFFELDIAPAVSFRGLGPVVPYAGLKFSWVDGDVEGNDFENDDMIGLFGGASYAVTPNVFVGGELRLIDEGAIGVYATFKF